MTATRGPRMTATAAARTLAAFVVLAGCGGGGKPPSADVAAAPWEVSAQSPLGDEAVSLDADSAGTHMAPDSLSPPPLAAPALADSGAATTRREPIQVPDPKDFTEGWRVQLSANSTLADADGRARGARARFTEPVYVEYEPPFYKVRVGDFLTRAEAESMATRARAEGYEGAWVVETLVQRPGR